MSVIGAFIVYIGFILVDKPWKLLRKPNTEEEKKEYLKRLKDFIFIQAFS